MEDFIEECNHNLSYKEQIQCLEIPPCSKIEPMAQLLQYEKDCKLPECFLLLPLPICSHPGLIFSDMCALVGYDEIIAEANSPHNESVKTTIIDLNGKNMFMVITVYFVTKHRHAG